MHMYTNYIHTYEHVINTVFMYTVYIWSMYVCMHMHVRVYNDICIAYYVS